METNFGSFSEVISRALPQREGLQLEAPHESAKEVDAQRRKLPVLGCSPVS